MRHAGNCAAHTKSYTCEVLTPADMALTCCSWPQVALCFREGTSQTDRRPEKWMTANRVPSGLRLMRNTPSWTWPIQTHAFCFWWMSKSLSHEQRGRRVKAASHLFVCVSGKQPEAGQPEEASFLTLTDRTGNGERLCVSHPVINYMETHSISSPDRYHPHSWWPACSVASRTESSRP